tara:strand:+ start:10 stop:1917 length:1908 start_codon:yes stop_codon:yes gene_type:complete
MCGIYGFYSSENLINKNNKKTIFQKLWFQSENRGKEACGITFLQNKELSTKKFNTSSTEAFNTIEFKSEINKYLNKEENSLLIGHSRLQTDGDRDNQDNNQPIVSEDNKSVLLHNGIICNFEDLFNKNKLKKETELDSEYLLKRLDSLLANKNFEESAKQLFDEIEGEATIIYTDKENILLATNCGNLYYKFNTETFEIVFASEKIFLNDLDVNLGKLKTEKLHPGSFLLLNINENTSISGSLNLSKATSTYHLPLISEIKPSKTSFWKDLDIQRCSKGILNEKMPFIEFDEEGVSNYSKSFQPIEKKPIKELEIILDGYRSNNIEKPDCVVGFSGGRDSSYLLDLLVTKYNMTPIAVTYEWGMVSDLARRNQARICGSLGVEHIIVSADIPENRKDINKYVSAWLKKPHLGMVPLFMAGDKKYFNVLNEVSKKYDTDLIIFGNAPYEFTDFKTGFAGIKPNFKDSNRLGSILEMPNISPKIKLSYFYFQEVIKNRGYWNKSIVNGVFAFKDSYFSSKDYIYFYDYEPWDEDKINNHLINTYNWEIDETIPSSWRIGDGTAPFYNFIYKAMAGFSEHDTFRNNQVLSGVLERDAALNIVSKENEPRFDKIKEYLDFIDLDFDKTIDRILEFRIDK